MKYVNQILIILTISFMGELCNQFLPFPIPASVYGLLIMLVALFTRLIKVEQIEEVSSWLILIMPVLFVPSAVSLMNVKEAIMNDLFIIALMTFVSTVVVMVVTGKVAQIIIERKEKNGQ